MIQDVLQSHGNQDCVVGISIDMTHQWTKIESIEINPYICGQLIFLAGGRIVPWLGIEPLPQP